MKLQSQIATRKTHDVVVIGGGSAGYAAARFARDAGADVAIVDQGPLGGLCILRGCMPTKAILRSAEVAALLTRELRPRRVVLDLNIAGVSGLTLIPPLLAIEPACRIVVLTGYASIATAVEAVRLGARHYLAKPANADEILAALQRDQPDAALEVSAEPLTVARLEWEHIQKVLAEHDGNISATARALKMHRRTLQRKLLKRPVAE